MKIAASLATDPNHPPTIRIEGGLPALAGTSVIMPDLERTMNGKHKSHRDPNQHVVPLRHQRHEEWCSTESPIGGGTGPGHLSAVAGRCLLPQTRAKLMSRAADGNHRRWLQPFFVPGHFFSASGAPGRVHHPSTI
jgi:hypothetical protein